MLSLRAAGVIKMIEIRNDIFNISTKNTTYLFRKLPTGHLEHVYYGKKLKSINMDALSLKNGFELGNSICYSAESGLCLEGTCQEASGRGRGDIRDPYVSLVHGNGSRTTDFIYEEHFLTEEGLTGELPHAYNENGRYEHLVISLKESSYGETLELHYVVYPNSDVITRSAKLINTTDDKITLKRLMSIQLDIQKTGLELHTFRGSWLNEMNHYKTPACGARVVNEAVVGASSNRANPFVMIADGDATENSGEVYGINLIYSGNHYEALEQDAYGISRFISGISPENFEFILQPGESFEAPEGVMSYTPCGFTDLSRNMHDFVRKHVVRGKWKKKVRPVLLNSWEACYFNFDENKLLSLARTAKEIGVELFVMDDGWFGKRNEADSSLGDWTPNTEKLPGGIKGIADKITKLGMMFGIWVEPEMVNVDSDLYRRHPEYVMEVPGKPQSEGRNQRILDLSQKKVEDHLFNEMKRVFSSGNISYVKWDMNRIFSEVYSKSLPADRQGEVSHRYMLGLYSLLRRLTEAFPDILFEGCAAGGNRFDLGMMCFFPQIWASDNTDAYCRLKIQESISYGYPMSVVASHVSGVPNHQTLRITPLSSRFNVAAMGILGYELNVKDMKPEIKSVVKQDIQTYKSWRKVLTFGDFYRNFHDGIYEFTIVSRNRKEAVGILFREKAVPNNSAMKFRAKGLLPEEKYHFYNIKKDENIMDFGDLINTATPVHIRQQSQVHYLLSKMIKLNGDVEDYELTGEELMNSGVGLTPSYSGTGYEDGTRLFGDYASRMYFMKCES